MSTNTGNGDEVLDLDQRWVEGVYDQLGKLEVELDPDPLVYGPKRLNGKVAGARNMLRSCEQLFLQISQDLHRFSRALRIAQTKLKLAKDYLFTNDPETRAGRNVADRESIAAMKLQAQIQEVSRLENGTEDLNALMSVVKAKRADLRDLQGRLRDQIRLCQEEIGLGTRWGSRTINAPDLDPDSSPRADVEELDKILQAVEGEIHLAVAMDPEEDDDETDEAPVLAPVRVAPPVQPAKPLPAPVPEDTESLDDLWEDSDSSLPEATVTSSEVDAFLNGMEDDAPPKSQPKKSAWPVASSEDEIDALLSSFD